jgi:geranylgeranyl pyrophosphate synthase
MATTIKQPTFVSGQGILMPNSSDIRLQVNRMLSAYFENQVLKAEGIDTSFARLWRTIQQVSEAGGKRLRPNLVMLGYAASGGTDFKSILPVATAQELLHQSLLIHDDIIDRDLMRHSELNVAGHMNTSYRELTVDHEHYASSAAILAGDLLITGAYQMVIEAQLDSDRKITIMHYMSDAYYDAGAGELMDTESIMRCAQDSDVIKIATYKTASYSFVGPLVCGAALGYKATPNLSAGLRSFGENLGIAYQLRDDVLGVFGNQNETGKSVLSDIREGKHTLLVQNALKAASKAQKAELSAALGNMQLTPEAAHRVAQIMRETRALAKTEMTIQQFIKEAQQALASLNLDPGLEAEAKKLIESVTARNS